AGERVAERMGAAAGSVRELGGAGELASATAGGGTGRDSDHGGGRENGNRSGGERNASRHRGLPSSGSDCVFVTFRPSPALARGGRREPAADLSRGGEAGGTARGRVGDPRRHRGERPGVAAQRPARGRPRPRQGGGARRRSRTRVRRQDRAARSGGDGSARGD